MIISVLEKFTLKIQAMEMAQMEICGKSKSNAELMMTKTCSKSSSSPLSNVVNELGLIWYGHTSSVMRSVMSSNATILSLNNRSVKKMNNKSSRTRAKRVVGK